MSGKGSADRSNVVKRGKSKMWCKCGYAKWACRCSNVSPLPRHPILDALSEACGWSLRDGKANDKCSVCGGKLQHDERIVYTNNEWRHWRCHKGGK